MKSKAGDFDGKIANADIQPLKAGDDMEPLKSPYEPKPGDETWCRPLCPKCGKSLGPSRRIYPPEEYE